MSIKDLLYETWQALLANKTRNLLTILGVVIGIAAVIAMTALIDGIRNEMYSEMGLDKSRLIEFSVYASDGKTLTFDDLETMERNLPGYEFVTGSKFLLPDTDDVSLHAGDKSFDSSVAGVTSQFLNAMQIDIILGDGFTEADLASGTNVVIIDKTLANRLFDSEENALGQTITYGKNSYSVVGVCSSSSSLMSSYAYVPVKTALRLSLDRSDEPDIISAFAREGYDIEKLVNETKEYLKNLFSMSDEEAQDAIYIMSMDEMIQEVDSFMGMFQALMTAVAGISLLVGGIGIMNMMLTNVTERIREIGLRKALGAHKSNIIAQFLMESIMLTLVGGIIGTAVGYGGALVLARFAGDLVGEGSTIIPVVSPLTAFLTATICIVIGVIFGLYPASRAANLDPVESLRHQ